MVPGDRWSIRYRPRADGGSIATCYGWRKINGDRSTGRTTRWRVLVNRRSKQRRSLSVQRSGSATGLKKGLAACQWMDGTCRLDQCGWMSNTGCCLHEGNVGCCYEGEDRCRQQNYKKTTKTYKHNTRWLGPRLKRGYFSILWSFWKICTHAGHRPCVQN